jgi:predicted aconitase with swiveling domain
MFLIRIVIIVAIIMALIPVINKAMEYFEEKSQKVKVIGESAKKIWKENTNK